MATSGETELLTGDRPPESIQGVLLSGNAFQFLGVAPVIGRTILPSDIKPTGEAEPVVVLSFKAWQRWFDGDPKALGKTLTLNYRPHTVIGVMPPRFGWYGNSGIWLPLSMDPRPTASQGDRFVNPIVRLSAGVSSMAAEQALQALHVRLAERQPSHFPRGGFTTRLLNYMDITAASGEMRSSLQLLFGAVGFLLLIACANVANLQLSRATARTREIAIRMAGAGRGSVLRRCSPRHGAVDCRRRNAGTACAGAATGDRGTDARLLSSQRGPHHSQRICAAVLGSRVPDDGYPLRVGSGDAMLATGPG
jgi:hypothetical protein